MSVVECRQTVTSKMARGGMSTATSGGRVSSSTEGSSTNFSFERAAGAGCASIQRKVRRHEAQLHRLPAACACRPGDQQLLQLDQRRGTHMSGRGMSSCQQNLRLKRDRKLWGLLLGMSVRVVMRACLDTYGIT